MAQTLGGSGIKTGTSHDRVQDPSSDHAPSAGDSPEEKSRVVFIPWPAGSPQADEWKTKSEQWNHAKGEEKQFEIVYYEKGKTSDALERASKDPNGVVYVRGHGGPGAKGMLTKMGDKFESLPMSDVCERLQEMGLGTDFAGSVKFHSCYSGTIFTDNIHQGKQESADRTAARVDKVLVPMKQTLLRTGIGNPQEIKKMEALKQQYALLRPVTTSMAKQGAEHMRDKGFANCRYYGYLGPVESAYGMDSSSSKPEDWHKHVDLEGLQSPTFGLPNGTNLKRVRASVARVRIR